MKFQCFATASVFVCASSAMAQSNVTLYGVIDLNLEYANHVGVIPTAANGFNRGPGNNVYRLNSGGLAGSRWGLRGTEDLGAGWKSVFALESGFSADSGVSQQAGRLFGRQAFVGLENARFGGLSFGRQYTSLYETLANFNPASYAPQYEPGALQSGANAREDNTVKYKGQFGKLTALAHYSFGVGTALPATIGVATPVGGNGEVPGSARRDSAYGAGLTYAVGQFGIAMAYDQWNPTIGTSSGTFKKAALAAGYALPDRMKFMGGYRWGQNRNAAGSLIQRDDYYWIGANVQVTPALSLMLEYAYDDVKNLFGTNAPNGWQINFMSIYSLSKRTDLYFSTAFAKNAGLTMDSLASAYASSIGFGNSYVLGNGQSTMVGASIGMRHKF